MTRKKTGNGLAHEQNQAVPGCYSGLAGGAWLEVAEAPGFNSAKLAGLGRPVDPVKGAQPTRSARGAPGKKPQPS